jgi:preprotein translocase subunit SecD
VAKEVLLDYTAIQSAWLGPSGQAYPSIELSFTDSGRKQFAELTRQYLHQRLAIIIDGKLWMAPVVQSPITEGKASVTGGFSEDEASALVEKINAAKGK